MAMCLRACMYVCLRVLDSGGTDQKGSDTAPFRLSFAIGLGGSVKSWKRRWFTLDRSLLTYAPKALDPSWTKSIAVSNISVSSEQGSS